MRRNILLGIFGIVGFLIACAGVATIQLIIGGLLPNNGPDPAATFEPSPEERAKQQWEAEQKQLGNTTTTQEPNEVTSAPEPTPDPATQPAPTPQPNPQLAPAPPPQPTYNPPAPPPPTGPGNFDAPQPSYPSPGATGPGNL